MVSITFMVNVYYIYGWCYTYGFYGIYGWYSIYPELGNLTQDTMNPYETPKPGVLLSDYTHFKTLKKISLF